MWLTASLSSALRLCLSSLETNWNVSIWNSGWQIANGRLNTILREQIVGTRAETQATSRECTSILLEPVFPPRYKAVTNQICRHSAIRRQAIKKMQISLTCIARQFLCGSPSTTGTARETAENNIGHVTMI